MLISFAINWVKLNAKDWFLAWTKRKVQKKSKLKATNMNKGEIKYTEKNEKLVGKWFPRITPDLI